MRRIRTARTNSEAVDLLASMAPEGEFLLLAPTKAAADELVWSRFPQGTLGAQRMTLAQLASQLAAPAIADLGLAPMTPLAMEALIARVLFDLRRDNALGYFAGIADSPGFARAAAATLTELRMNGITAAALKSASEASEGMASARDFARILAAYEDLRIEERLADIPAIFQHAMEADSHRLLGTPLLALDVPVRDAASERLLAKLALASPSASAVMSVDDAESLAALERAWQTAREETSEPSRPEVSFFAAPGENLECVEIARRARQLSLSGVPFDRMAILLRHPDRYQPLVEEALRRAGIPGYYSHGAIRPDPAGRAFLALIHCAMEHCSASRFTEYLSLAEAPSAPAGWEQLIVDAAVVGGAARWERRLSGLAEEIHVQLREESRDDAESPRREALMRRRDQLQALAEFALPLIQQLDSLPASALWGDWIAKLSELAAASLKHPAHLTELLQEMQPMADVGPVSLDEVHAVLAARLGTMRREPRARRFGAVFVGTLEEARGLSFDTVFLPGLAEGLFPKRVLEDPLLLDEAREKLPASLPVNATRAERERLLLRIALAAGSKLVASYPTIDSAQSRERVMSFYFLEVARLAEGEFPRIDLLKQRAREEASLKLGWPAPHDPAHAVDDAEYDLAVLIPAVKSVGDANQGAARYMLDANETLARSLRTRWKRWEARNWSDADGPVGSALLLAPHRMSERTYTATGLQRFAACPYQFFLHSIHRLTERDAPVAIEQMDALTRGSLFHEVQHEFFNGLDADGDLESWVERCDEILDRIALKYAENLAPAIPRVWSSEVEQIRTDLRGWLRELSRERNWLPICSELEIDEVVFERLKLKGRVDLVERDAVASELRVTDHKTGAPPKERPLHIGRGAYLQPLLYAAAVAQHTREIVSKGRLFFCTQRGEYAEVEIVANDAGLHHAAEAVRIIDESIEAGTLVPAPADGACEQCDYRIVCGPYEEQRLKRKHGVPLASLAQLRAMP